MAATVMFQFTIPTQSTSDQIKRAVGASAAIATTEFLLYPIHRWRTMVFTSMSPQLSLYQQFLKMATVEAPHRHYLGSGVWAATVFSQSMAFSLAYRGLTKNAGVDNFTSSLVSVLGVSSLFYPITSVIRRLHIDSLSRHERYRYLSFGDALHKIRLREGWRGLYAGYLPFMGVASVTTLLVNLFFSELTISNRFYE